MDNKQVSYRQLELLLDFMEQHRALALGRVRGKEGNAVSQQLWQKCSAILNAEFNGARKTVPEWKKYYNQYKSRIKAKNTLIMNGGGPGTPTALTPLEERLCSILGRCSSPLSVCQKDEAGAMHDEQDSMYGDSTSNDWKIMETHTEANVSKNVTVDPGVYVTIENDVMDVTPSIINGRTASTAPNDDNENGGFPHVNRQEPQSQRIYTEPYKRSHRARLHALKATSEFKAASNRLTRLVESRLKVDRAMVCAINRQAAAFEGLADELRKFTSMYAQNMVERKMAKQEE